MRQPRPGGQVQRAGYIGTVEKSLFAAKVIGCLMGGALADASGSRGADGLWPASNATALSAYTVDGLTEAVEWANSGVVADETACLWLAYLRWLASREALVANAPMAAPRWIDSQAELHTTLDDADPDTLAALRSGEMGTTGRPLNSAAAGPGALVRSAGFGLLPHVDLPTIHRLSRNSAALTHGHASARDAAAGFSVVIRLLIDTPIPESVPDALAALRTAYAAAGDFLGTIPGQEGVLAALNKYDDVEHAQQSSTALDVLGNAIALSLSSCSTGNGSHNDPQGQLSAALAAAARIDTPVDGSPAAQRHTAVLVGSLLGALYGDAALPNEPVNQLAAAPTLRQLAAHWVDCTAA